MRFGVELRSYIAWGGGGGGAEGNSKSGSGEARGAGEGMCSSIEMMGGGSQKKLI